MYPRDFSSAVNGHAADESSSAAAAAESGGDGSSASPALARQQATPQASQLATQQRQLCDALRFCLRHVGRKALWKELSLLLHDLDPATSTGHAKKKPEPKYAPMRFVSHESLALAE